MKCWQKMVYKTLFHKKVEKFLDSHLDIKTRTLLAFKKISNSPYNNDTDSKKLKGTQNHYRLRIGKYRFLYEICDNEMLIYSYKSDSRGDIYKK